MIPAPCCSFTVYPSSLGSECLVLKRAVSFTSSGRSSVALLVTRVSSPSLSLMNREASFQKLDLCHGSNGPWGSGVLGDWGLRGSGV
jgi:hypothetical protein